MISTLAKATAMLAVLAVTTPMAAQAHPAAVAHRTVDSGGTTYRLTLAAPTTIRPSVPTTITGQGYNAGQGIFVALCAIPAGVKPHKPATFTARPTPCLGPRGAGNTSRRIVNGATGEHTSPYGPNGSFLVQLDLQPKIADGVECDVDVRCAIVTRADFTATDDRTWDLYLPVRFRRG
ncbi:hypothetical protein UK23_21745 [Lentzea aerocolonigenes]|uniref:Uncharacterized protein n=1 Tax=Lentzea aerocolonigenes TaxID=68170 RepID=A0A0F0GUM8_LENAE|nr:hypothetical protein [Lentzea aerocolonigenes]KJK46980.1 hypothetical protein UK23_21745 [Lentzea aerocolonigenes]